MSLKVWLPLNGNLENKGTSNYTINVFRGSEVYDNNGKIGKCFNANGTNALKIINIIPDFYNYNAYSLCVWCYCTAQNTSHTGSGIISGGNWNNQLINLAMSDWSSDHYTRLRISGPNWNRTYTYNFNLNTWYHIVVCCDGIKTYAYVNGNLIGNTVDSFLPTSIEGNDICIGGATYYAGMQFFGKINDVRIYDHCLSTAEIKEISQGLVAHYRLNNFQGEYGNPNLITNFDTSFSSYDDGTTTLFYNQMNNGTQEIISNFAGVNKCLHLHSNGGSNRQYRTFSATSGKTYTVSADYYSTSTQSTAWRGELTGGNYSWESNSAGAYDTPGSWKRMSYTYSNLTSNATIYFFIHCTNGTDCYIKNIKIEEGDSMTPWGPSGTSTTIIEDNSGYNNNGTTNGTFELSNNTSKYDNSLLFNGTDNAIKIPFNDMIKGPDYTISVWTYKTVIGTKGYQTILGGPSGFELEARSSSSTDPLYRIHNWGGGTTPYEFNKWNLFTFVRTTNDSKLYVNGELKITGSAGSIPIGDYFIGAWKTSTQQNYEGLMSDFRIYATALSVDDIKSLYQMGAAVDNLQNLHIYETEETNNNLFAGKFLSSDYYWHNPISIPFVNFNSNGEYQFTANNTSAGSEYIQINPTGHTYYYDYTISVNTGNQFYIGFERYDENKTSRSNNACVYTYTTKPSSDVVRQRFIGTVDLSTDGTNPCKYIALRILNGWSGTTSGVTGTATIHSFSLREVGTKQTQEITKTGRCIEEEIIEVDNIRIQKNGIIETNNLIEF